MSAQSETAKALHYGLKRWRAMGRFLFDGELEIDNRLGGGDAFLGSAFHGGVRLSASDHSLFNQRGKNEVVVRQHSDHLPFRRRRRRVDRVLRGKAHQAFDAVGLRRAGHAEGNAHVVRGRAVEHGDALHTHKNFKVPRNSSGGVGDQTNDELAGPREKQG